MKVYLYNLVNEIIANNNSSFVLTQNKIYSWGYNEDGELGLNIQVNTPLPTIVDGLNNKNITHISFYNNHGIALSSKGNCYVWGFNHNNEIGVKSNVINCDSLNESSISIPQLLPFFNKMIVYNVTCGGNHTLFITTPFSPLDNTIYDIYDRKTEYHDYNTFNTDLDYKLNCLFKNIKNNNNNEVIKMIEDGIDIECVDKNGNTPFISSCLKNNIELVRYFINKGCNINKINNLGYNAFQLCKKYKYHDIMYLLNDIMEKNRK